MSRSPRQPFRAPAIKEILARSWDSCAKAYRCEWLGDGGHCGPRCETVIAYRGVRPKGAPQGALDHLAACWTASETPVGDRPPLGSADGWMLCPTHHKAKSAREARERARTDGAAKIHAAHLAALATKLEGAVETVAKPKRKWPTQKMKGRGFPKKEDRQLFSKGYHHGR